MNVNPITNSKVLFLTAKVNAFSSCILTFLFFIIYENACEYCEPVLYPMFLFMLSAFIGFFTMVRLMNSNIEYPLFAFLLNLSGILLILCFILLNLFL